jgi:hypothetical protein
MSGTGKPSLDSNEQTNECARHPEIHLAFVDREG